MLKNFFLVGPPGSGKGTLGALLKARLGVRHLSTGELLRSEVLSSSDVGMQISEVMKAGRLVADDLVFRAVDSFLQTLPPKEDCVVVWDGFPRNLSQASRFFDDFSLKLRLGSIAAVFLDVPRDELVRRLLMRWTCSACNAPGSYSSSLDPADVACNSCGKRGTLYRRPDDSLVAIKNRLDVYDHETQPLLDFYRERGCLISLDAARSQELVYLSFGALAYVSH